MIAIICAMSEERDAFISLMKDVKETSFEKINYHGKPIDNKCFKGNLAGKEVIVVHSGVGKVYAAIVTTLVIKKFKPELVVNVGCAGSLNENVHVGDVVVASRVADWDVDVPGWQRSIFSDKVSFACDGRFTKLVSKVKTKLNINTGYVVSGDEFIYKKGQVKEIKRYYKDALCGEMEGASIANTCYAFSVNVAIVRSISDETLVNGSYKNFDFNLDLAVNNAAKLCKEIIKRY